MASDRHARFRFPHAMIFYHEREDLEKLLAPLFSTGVRHKDVVCIFPAKTEKRSQHLADQVKRLALSRPKLLIKDSSVLFAKGTDPVATFRDSLIEIAQQVKEVKDNGGQWIQIGDWVHLMYEDAETLVKMERGLNDVVGLDSLMCTYRIEGFCSLDLKNLTQLVDAHDRFIFQASDTESRR
jgi:hypothetical protein